MSRLSSPGCMLRAMSALFGAIFLPVGVSFFFVLRRQHWPEGIGAVVAALFFFYVAWRAEDILGLDEIRDTRDVPLPPFPPLRAPAVDEPSPQTAAHTDEPGADPAPPHREPPP